MVTPSNVSGLVMVVMVLAMVMGIEAMDVGERSTSELASNILRQMQGHLNSASHSPQARMYGSCTDSFSVFGFLAFLLALLDLILELQAMDAGAGGMRKKRHSLGDMADIGLQCQEDVEMEEAASASYSLLRGFLNALETPEPQCVQRFLCEAAEEAVSAGPLAAVVARVGSLNAGSWLLKVNSSLYAAAGEAGTVGATEGGCAIRYSQCFELPPSYRHPGVYRGLNQYPSQVYQPVLDEVMDVVREALL